MAFLEVRNVHTYYGNIHALKGISFEVNAGEIVTLIGSNGAGKTTTLRTISGLMHPREGEVIFDGEYLHTYPAHELVDRGIAMVPEGRGIFGKLTVLENLEMGAFKRNNAAEIREDLEHVFSRFPRLEERQKQLGGTLSGGEQQMLAIGRALMARPRILLLDEPSMGLAPILVDRIFEEIVYLNKEQGTTILLVEQNALMALEVAHRGYVLQTGQIINSGDSQTLRTDPKVVAAYLGG
jgi:branched-chain amino acid transport system ATP-binding protein